MTAQDDETGQSPTDEGVVQAIRQQRIETLDRLRSLGIDPYPSGPIEKISAVEALARPDDEAATVAGRIMLLRVLGNIAFLHLRDESGDIQVVLSRREMDQHATPDQGFKFWVKTLDLGDFISADGVRMTTKAGEPSVSAHTVTLLAKCLRPLPDKHAGLTNEDVLLRKRYLDIMLHRDVQDMIYRKARFWRSMRDFLHDRGFVEVATPVLELTTGGADARPFVTHHNFLDTEVSLRISTGELWQKRLLVGGLEKVFEIGRQFRNESQSREHANDYEQMEFYWAYANASTGMPMVEELFKHVARETFGTLQFSIQRGDQTFEVDLDQPWQRYDYAETVANIADIDVFSATTEAMLDRLTELDGSTADDTPLTRARAMDLLWKHCRRQIAGPGFLVNEPIETSPLAKRDRHRPDVAERFHVLIAGSELGNGYSELNDPIDQAARFATQQRMRDAGDAEAQESDSEFVEALEYGMPPALGFGLSERVFAFFMNKSIRESQIFPLLKPLNS